jgi:Domain of unknown function (DUF5011)
VGKTPRINCVRAGGINEGGHRDHRGHFRPGRAPQWLLPCRSPESGRLARGYPTASSSDTGATTATTTASTSTPPVDTEPPVITINGENPAHIHVGDTYADHGATVTDNVDQNLGIKTYLNGALVSNIVLDTSTSTTDTIDYVATDAAGNTATSTRTVLVDPSIEIRRGIAT